MRAVAHVVPLVAELPVCLLVGAHGVVPVAPPPAVVLHAVHAADLLSVGVVAGRWRVCRPSAPVAGVAVVGVAPCRWVVVGVARSPTLLALAFAFAFAFGFITSP